MKKYEQVKFTPCDEMIALFLDGAVAVWKQRTRFVATVLLRLPKGKFHKSETDDREFEYIQFEQRKGQKMYHAVSRNGTLRSVKKATQNDHWETHNDMYRVERVQEQRSKA